MDKPLISVIIPAYNHPELLTKAIESVLVQTYSYFELLVIDDGSEIDLTAYILKYHSDNRLKYYKLKHSNANVARNYGIKISEGKYIAMLDSDDIWLDFHLEQCLNEIGNADGLYGSLILRYGNPHKDKIVYTRDLDKKESMIEFLLKSGYGAQTSTLFLTTESAKNILWNEKLLRHQDYDFIVRYHRQYTLKALHEPSVIYLKHPQNSIIDFGSCISFIQEYENEINPVTYMLYNINMLKLAKKYNVDQWIVQHYIYESTKHLERLSYCDYLSIIQPKTSKQLFMTTVFYIYKIMKFVIKL